MGCGNSISIYQEDIEAAAASGIITQEQAALIWPNLVTSYDQRWRLTWVRLAYAFGAFLIVGSLTWFTSLAWQNSTGLELFCLSSSYVLTFLYAGNYFWKNNNPYVPQIVGGIFTTISVALSPVVTYALQRYFNYWFYDGFEYLPEEATMALYGAAVLYFIQFPFITVPICAAIYSIIGNNLAEIFFGPYPTLEQYCWASIGGGALVLSGGYLLGKQMGSNFSFFPFICGISAFWGGWTCLFLYPIYTSWLFKFAYLGMNLGLLGFGYIIQQIPFWVSGSLGVVTFAVDTLYHHGTVEFHAWSSIFFGAILSGISYYYSQKNPESEFPFWGYLTGVSIFWGGWDTLYWYPVYSSQIFKFIYFLVNVGMMILTIPTKQRVFFYEGLVGAFGYITDEVDTYWSNSWYLPFILTLVGLAFIALAVYFSNHPGSCARKKQVNSNEQNESINVPLQEVYSGKVFVFVNYENKN